MKQFFKMFFASFLAMVVMGVIVVGLTIGLIASLASEVSEDKKQVSANSVLRIEMDKVIHEIGETNPLAALGNGLTYSPGLYDITKAIEYAKTDKDITGIFIKLDISPN